MLHGSYIFLLTAGVLLGSASGMRTNNSSNVKVMFADQNKSPKARILAGNEVSHHKYRFVVAIMRRDTKTSEEYQSCTGSVVKADLILTACHCVGDVVGTQVKLFDARLVRVIAGTSSIYEDSPERQVARARAFVAHWKCQYYEPGTIIETDAALVILKDSLDIDSEIQPLNMVENVPKALKLRLDSQIRMKTVCKLPGFGYSEPDTPTWVLREAKLKLISAYDCRKLFCGKLPSSEYCNFDYGAKNVFCALPISSTEGATPCKGDSGAPLVCEGYVYGILTWGGCRPEYPVVLTTGAVALELIKLHGKPRYGDARRSNSGWIPFKRKIVWFLIPISILIPNMMT